MDNAERVIISTLGKTAAGKTSIARFASCALGIDYISEGEIKRALVTDYSWRDSLDENLRDRGYKRAIERAAELVNIGGACILDASFHKAQRRAWLFKEIKELHGTSVILYCECNNIAETERRILSRKSAIKNADTQADSIEIYNFINDGFEELSTSEIPHELPVLLFHIDTSDNAVIDVRVFNEKNGTNVIIDGIGTLIHRYLFEMRGR